MRFWRYLLLIGVLFGIAGCAAQANRSAMVTMTAVVIPFATPSLTQSPTPQTSEPATPAAVNSEVTNTASTNIGSNPTSTNTQTPTITPFPTPTFDPETWATLPVIPELGPRAQEILKDGLDRGNNPHAFAKVGDCESRASWFLEYFDLGPENYSLGSYEAELAPVIPYFTGSFKRVSVAARPGYTAASLMAPIWAEKQVCEKGEGPLACEYRIQRPIVALVMLGTNDASNPKTFERRMRTVIEYSIEQGVLPVLGTKADNVEKDHYINKTIARLAAEYGLPLWNYWAAVQDLPDNGLQPDGVHLTFGTPDFGDPDSLKRAWPVRNLNALQILKGVMDQIPQ